MHTWKANKVAGTVIGGGTPTFAKQVEVKMDMEKYFKLDLIEA